MPKDKGADEGISMANTKKEMLEAYQRLQKELLEKRVAEMRPEQKIEEKRKEEAIAVSDAISTEGIGKQIGTLKSEIGGMFVSLSDKLEAEIAKYRQVKQAVAAKEKELAEIYEIQKTATTLAALLEVQEQKRATFEADMAEQREALTQEIETERESWERESQEYAAQVKERNAEEKKRRDRETEEYKYAFEREQQLAREQFDYEKAKLEREVQFKKEEMERDLSEREKVLAQGEAELDTLRAKANAFPQELEAAVAKAVKETADRVGAEAANKEELLKREFQGQENVLKSKIESLEKTVAEQSAQIAALSAQLEKSYVQVQDIAVKAIEGSSNAKAFGYPQPVMTEQTQRAGQSEK